MNENDPDAVIVTSFVLLFFSFNVPWRPLTFPLTVNIVWVVTVAASFFLSSFVKHPENAKELKMTTAVIAR